MASADGTLKGHVKQVYASGQARVFWDRAAEARIERISGLSRI